MARRKASAAVQGDGAARQPRQHSLVWMQGLLCGAVAALATPTALLLGVLLGPALVATALESEPGRPIGRSVMLFSAAASVRPLKTLWLTGHTMPVAASLVGDFQVVATAWSAAAAGWLLAQLLPIAVRTVLEALGLARSAQLKAERARLVADWGLEEDQGEDEP